MSEDEPYAVNGHLFESAKNHRRMRDVLFYRCSKCGLMARTSMRSKEPTQTKLEDIYLAWCSETKL